MALVKEKKMTDNVAKPDRTDPRPTYDPPRALSLSHMGTGTGGAIPCGTGSAAEGNCATGLVAVAECGGNGSSATSCAQDGSSATNFCIGTGSNVPE